MAGAFLREEMQPTEPQTDNIDYDKYPWLRPRPARMCKELSHQEIEQWKTVTTVMMRNLPNKYQRDMLRRDLDRDGFADKYDFFYLPMDKETNANRGYAFINLLEPVHAMEFKLKYDGNKLSMTSTNKKVVAVTIAELQGFQANYSHYSKSRVNSGPEYTRPLFLRGMSKEEAEQADQEEWLPIKRPPRPPLQSQWPDQAIPPRHWLDPPPQADGVQDRMPSQLAKYCPYCGENEIENTSHTYCLSCRRGFLVSKMCQDDLHQGMQNLQSGSLASPSMLMPRPNLHHHAQEPVQGYYSLFPQAAPGLPPYHASEQF